MRRHNVCTAQPVVRQDTYDGEGEDTVDDDSALSARTGEYFPVRVQAHPHLVPRARSRTSLPPPIRGKPAPAPLRFLGKRPASEVNDEDVTIRLALYQSTH